MVVVVVVRVHIVQRYVHTVWRSSSNVCVGACARVYVCVRCCELQHRLPVREQMSQSSGTAATGDNRGGKNMSARWLFSLGLISRTQHTDRHTHARACTQTHTHAHTHIDTLQ